MTIALYATESLALESIASALAAEGLPVRAIDADEIRSLKVFGPEITKGVLIVPKYGAGAQTAWFRGLLGEDRELILCAVQPETEGYEKLRRVGATTIITPRSWAPEHIAERILGQLILDDEITPSACGAMKGATRLMRNLYQDISVIAPLDYPILITGETGTGKELVAQQIHKLSKRPDKFVDLNCGMLNKDLAGSELFGHSKGAFTSADQPRLGLLLEAGKGTVFLDEIGELNLDTQVFLLRVLEEKKVRPIGSNQSHPMHARVVLATNRDLELECEKGRFRYDLLQRICGFTLELPPLRYRRADIPLLAHEFLKEFNGKEDRKEKQPVSIAPGTLDCLFSHQWPGNVRELHSVIQNAMVFADANGFMSALHLMQAIQRRRSKAAGRMSSGAKHSLGFDPRVDTWKKFSERAHVAYFQAVLEVAAGNKKEAQRLSGLGSSQFYENLKTLSRLVEDDADHVDDVS